MAIDELIGVVAPPSSPLNVGSVADMARIEDSIGTKLPSDYWDYVIQYGSGRFLTSNFDFVVYNPFADNYNRGVELDLDMLQTIRDLNYAIHPFRPGLFPWGGDVNGNTLFWETRGEPEEWPIVLCPETGLNGDFEKFNVSITSFLAGVIQRSIHCSAWDQAMAFVDGETSFVPG